MRRNKKENFPCKNKNTGGEGLHSPKKTFQKKIWGMQKGKITA